MQIFASFSKFYVSKTFVWLAKISSTESNQIRQNKTCVCCIKQIINFSHLGISLITLDMHYVVVRRLDTFTEHAKKSKLRT